MINRQGGIAGLMKDFRVDEENGMEHAVDPRLENRNNGLKLVDRLN